MSDLIDRAAVHRMLVVELARCIRDKSDKVKMSERVLKCVEAAPTVDPVHAAGGCYCDECKLVSSVASEGHVFCAWTGNEYFSHDFCSQGARGESLASRIDAFIKAHEEAEK